MPAEILRRKNWRSEMVPRWTIVGLSPTDAAYWMHHIRQQAKVTSLLVEIHAATTLPSPLDQSVRVLVVAGEEESFVESCQSVRSVRKANSDLPIIVWLPKLADRCGSVYLESGASVIITRREQTPIVAARLMQITSLPDKVVTTK